jgi:glutamyl/glutaminyl-tRNA synthetase
MGHIPKANESIYTLNGHKSSLKFPYKQNKSAYYCFCSNKRIGHQRDNDKETIGKAAKYDRLCLSLPESEVRSKLDAGLPYVIRLRMPYGKAKFNDLIYGEVVIDYSTMDDQIIIKSDGLPTYHFANVIDDHLMKISHIMRGEEWISSTAKHILLYKLLELPIPKYAHIPNLIHLTGMKISKRNPAFTVNSILDNGIEPEALTNYLMNISTKSTYSEGEEEVKEGNTIKMQKIIMVPEVQDLSLLAKKFSFKSFKTNKIVYDEKKLGIINQDKILSDLKSGTGNIYLKKGNFIGDEQTIITKELII